MLLSVVFITISGECNLTPTREIGESRNIMFAVFANVSVYQHLGGSAEVLRKYPAEEIHESIHAFGNYEFARG